MASTRSALLVNPTPRKISIGKPNKIKQRRSRILNLKLRSLFEVPEDSLNCHPMWRAWGSMKACTKIHGELNVRLCRREVQEGADHALYSLWSMVKPFSSRCGTASMLIIVYTGLSSAMLNFFIKSFTYLAWCMKMPSFVCFTWIPKKKVISPIMDIWNSFSIIS
jgi:hypothetical protein